MSLETLKAWMTLLPPNVSFPENLTNNLDISGYDVLFHEIGALEIALTSLYVPLFVSAFFGNLSILILVASIRYLRHTTNIYLCNMAIADLLGKFAFHYF